MKSLKEYILEKRRANYYEKYVLEMATIDRNALTKNKYKIAIHGIDASDRPNPHIHIYMSDDVRPFSKFNFEISLCDILCKDEINLIKMKDKKKDININNRDKCSWKGYHRLHDEFEDWLFSKSKYPGEFKDNLDAIVWNYNHECTGSVNYVKEYIKEQGWKVLPKYKYYVDNNDQN